MLGAGSDEKSTPVLFGQFLLNSGAITPRQLMDAIQVQIDQNQLFGEIGRKLEKLTDEQVVEVISAIHDNRPPGYSGMKFGEAAHRMGFITEEDIAAIIEVQMKSKKKIGEILVGIGALTPQECERHLQNYIEWKKSPR